MSTPLDASSQGEIGTLFLVVGPSGVGKDTLLDAAREKLTLDYSVAQRVVTRPLSAGGEAHEPMDDQDFDAAEADGAFAVSWRAHGYAYGIRHAALSPLRDGTNVLVNASRRTITDFVASHPRTVVISITALPETVLARLNARGREDAEAVAGRMAREGTFDSPVPVIEIANDTSVADAANRFVAAVESKAHLARVALRAPLAVGDMRLCFVNRDDPIVRARRLGDGARIALSRGASAVATRVGLAEGDTMVRPGQIAVSESAMERLSATPGDRLTIRPLPKPASRDALRAKIAGGTLSSSEIDRLVRDLVDELYAPEEISGFLVAASQRLSTDEVAALTKARAGLVSPPAWSHRIVADKHSMGGVPGSRISPVIVSIVAAHGLAIPKTSSRAITSAAGTADVMECVARVDLSRDALVRVVDQAGGAVAWSGRISHTPLDDVMNAINRPLGIRSAALDVSSILSKKLAVGATHVLIDIPLGPTGKVKSSAEAHALAELFCAVGRAVGLHVEPKISDGSRPIGSGVGPALELYDVMMLLSGSRQTDPGLHEKALDVAGRIIAWDPSVGPERGRDRASEILSSGAAWETFNKIVDAQGRAPAPDLPGSFTVELPASKNGIVDGVDSFALSGIARAAGAPRDKGAGVMLRASIGSSVSAGDTLAVVCASTPGALDTINTDTALYRLA